MFRNKTILAVIMIMALLFIPIASADTTHYHSIGFIGDTVKPDSTTVTAWLYDGDGNLLFASGTTAPSSEEGYAKGCTFLDTDATGDSIYLTNKGTTSSCTFSTGTAATSFIALTDTPVGITTNTYYKGDSAGTALDAGIVMGTTTATNGNVLIADGTDWDTSTKDSAGIVTKSGDQTGIAGAKTWTGAATFSSSVAVAGGQKLTLRDATEYIYSSANGQTDIAATDKVQIVTSTVDINGAVTMSGNMLAESTAEVQFYDSDMAIRAMSDGTLGVKADTEVQIDTTTLDINANVDISGTLGVTGALTASSTTALNDTVTVGTDKKLQFRDTGLFVRSGTDGKLTYSSDGAGDDDHSFIGTVTFSDAALFREDVKLQFRDSGVYAQSGTDGKFTLSSDGTGADDITLDGTVTFGDDTILGTDKKIQFRDTGIYAQSGADGKLTIAADGTGSDDITISGTLALSDDVLVDTDKSIQFRDIGIYMKSGSDGKLTISSDGVGADDITMDGTVTFSDDAIFSTDKKIQFRDTGNYIKSGSDGEFNFYSDGTGADAFNVVSDGGFVLDAVDAVDVNSSTSTINIANDDIDQAVNVATDGERTVTIGSVNGAAGLVLQAGTGNFSMAGVAASTFTFGKADQTGTMSFAASTGALTCNIATGATGNKTVHIADHDTPASTITQGGAASTVTLDGATITIGDSDTVRTTGIATGNAVQTVNVMTHDTPVSTYSLGGTNSKVNIKANAGITMAAVNYAADAGGDDAYVTTLSPAPTAYTTGQMFLLKVATANTDGCSLDVNGLGALAIKTATGTDPATNDIVATSIAIIVYDGTDFLLVNPATTTD